MRHPENKPADPIFIENAQGKFPLSLKKYRDRARAALLLLGKTKKHRITRQTAVNFRFVDDKEIGRWHRRYFGDSAPTDVIAFSMREGKPLSQTQNLLGDVVVSVETARRQAKKFKKTWDEELTLYMIHGMLHLLGYDDLIPAKKKVMERLQFSILDKVMKK